MKTDCDVIMDLMPLYTDGICSEKSRQLVQEHCGECACCRERLSSMQAPVPEAKKAGSPENPLKKTKRHYIRLALITALICIAVMISMYPIVRLSVNEMSKRSDKPSWSTIAAERKMKKTGQLIKKGQCEQALSEVGIIALDNTGIFLGNSENADIRKSLADNFGRLTESCPVTDISCNAMYMGTEITGELTLKLEETSTPVPVQICMSFIRRDDGKYYITQAILGSCSHGPEEDKHLFELNNIYGLFLIPDYPGDYVVTRLHHNITAGKSEPTYFGEIIITSEKKAFQQESMDIINSYIIYNDREKYYIADTENPDCKTEMAEWRVRNESYENDFETEAKALLCEDYRYISINSERPYYVSEILLEGSPYAYESKGCFRQKITINMETEDGTAFSVSFSARAGYYFDTPFGDITYSENTPRDFKDRFEKLFC